MKTILIPTDFSQAALRAVEFGVMFAKKPMRGWYCSTRMGFWCRPNNP